MQDDQTNFQELKNTVEENYHSYTKSITDKEEIIINLDGKI